MEFFCFYTHCIIFSIICTIAPSQFVPFPSSKTVFLWDALVPELRRSTLFVNSQPWGQAGCWGGGVSVAPPSVARVLSDKWFY